jgi:hypothetical protein
MAKTRFLISRTSELMKQDNRNLMTVSSAGVWRQTGREILH